MAFAFDTLGYAKKLRSAGVPQDQAEAHTEAAREFVLAELVTHNHLQVTRRELEAAIDPLSLRITVLIGVMLAAAIASINQF